MDEEERNYCTLTLLLYRVGLPKLRQCFIKKWNSVGGFLSWTNCHQNGADLLTKFKPSQYERWKVESGDTSVWDVALLVKALLNTTPPLTTNPLIRKALTCLKDTRNHLCHPASVRIETSRFEKLYEDACSALKVLGGTQKEFDKVLEDVQQPWNELMPMVKHCAKQDEKIRKELDEIMNRLDKLNEGQEQILQGQSGLLQGQSGLLQGQSGLLQGQSGLLQGQSGLLQGQSGLLQGQSGLLQGQSGLLQGQSGLLQGQQNTHTKQDEILEGIQKLTGPSKTPSQLSREGVKRYSEKLKDSTKAQTDFQPKLLASDSVQSYRTDEIFTNLTIQRGQKGLKDFTPSKDNRLEHLTEYQTTCHPIQCQDIFINPEKDKPNPKTILVLGKPGIGKSLFCQRLVRDWADGVVFHNNENSAKQGDDFDFVYLMTFRCLNLLKDKSMNFCEVLNHCCEGDERSSVDDALFEYLIEHSDRVMFILDGYDEYYNGSDIYDNSFEMKFKNNALAKMPVAALISKLLRKKIFASAVVLVTSRPNKSDEIGGIQKDAVVEINGFSAKQVQDFIGKYFNSKNEEVRCLAQDHIMNNMDLLSIAHIPMVCYLMCWCVDWHIETEGQKGLPAKITELYSEVVEIFELKHNCKSNYKGTEMPQSYNVPDVIKDTVKKISELACTAYENNKIVFDENDMEKFSLTNQEIDNLKGSGLITCGSSHKIGPFKMTRDFTFSHLTLHEYFAACGFINKNRLPALKINGNEMVIQFYAGLLSRLEGGHGERLMEELITMLISSYKNGDIHIAKCLYEYGDEAFGIKMIEKHHNQFCDDEGDLFGGVPLDISDYAVLIFFINLINKCHSRYSSVPDSTPFSLKGLRLLILGIRNLEDSTHKFEKILELLKSDYSCPIVNVCLYVDEEMLPFSTVLPLTNITTLSITGIGNTDIGLSSLSTALPSTNITSLNLYGGYTDIGLSSLSKVLPSTNITTLTLDGDYTDIGLSSLSKVLPSTNITSLYFYGNGYTDIGLSSIRTALPSLTF